MKKLITKTSELLNRFVLYIAKQDPYIILFVTLVIIIFIITVLIQ